jgi:TonB family protein
MKFDKDDDIALIGTIIIHLIAFIILYISVIRTILPDEDSGVLVNFGDISASIGMLEPVYSANTPQKEVQPQPTTTKPQPTAKEELITQDEEETVSIPEKKKKENEEEAAEEKAKREREEAERRRKEEEEKQREEQRRKEEAISNQVSGAFGVSRAQESQQGNATAGTGNQGSPFGNTDTGENEGIGGYGSFNLSGRSLGSGGLPRPDYNAEEEGRIVLDITVDPKGNVIMAEIGRGTNITNDALRKSARDAARRAKFNKIQGTNNQNGTITYNYKLK